MAAGKQTLSYVSALIEVREKIVRPDKIGTCISSEAKLSKARPVRKLLRFSHRITGYQEPKSGVAPGFNYFAFTIHMGSNCYINTDVRDLEVALFKANLT